ncbi:unnamed protein product [Rodentolepis nana]|uniref:C2H2-type domain-containing protein n=1 Tax=Rodentolepis nana TaxID=102285 RepID=A0A0R3T6I1_RODNA|nr:unnamed protein product [Rodentolepis nana]
MASRPNRITSLTSSSSENLHLSRLIPTPSPAEHSSLRNIFMNDTTKLTVNVTAGSQMFPFFSSISALSTNVSDTRNWNAADSLIHGFHNATTEGFRSNQKSVESTPSNSWRSHRTKRMRLTEYSCNWCRMTFPKVKDLDKYTKEIHGKYCCQKYNSEFTEFANVPQDQSKRHMDSRHPGYNPARDIRVDGDNARFLKYTQIAVNNDHQEVETPEVRNLPVDLTSSKTQVGFVQMDTSSGVTIAVKAEEKPEDTFA